MSLPHPLHSLSSLLLSPSPAIFLLQFLILSLSLSLSLSLFLSPSLFSLSPDHLTKFQMETLFYLFYSMPKDLLQACAAQELYRREWRYHGELRLWLKMRNQQDIMQGQPNVQFLYFDVSGWEARLFTSQYRGNIVSGLLSEEEVRVKAPLHSQAATAQPGGS